jgi:hypothetical protein
MPDAGTFHPQVAVSYLGQTIQVDEELAPLLQDLWTLGLHTHESCQSGGNDRTYIYFTSRQAGRDFFNLVYDLVFFFDFIGCDDADPNLRGSIVTFQHKDLAKVVERIANLIGFKCTGQERSNEKGFSAPN